MEKAVDYIRQNFTGYVEEMKEYLRIPSISALPENKADVDKCADFLVAKLKSAGLKNAEKIPTEGHPLVYAEWMEAKGKPTILIYGHYDVQPVDPLDQWTNPPFDPVVKDNVIYARGTSDDKGQNFIHIKSVEALLKTYGTLPVNVKFILEGEEEVGSENLTKFLSKNKKMLECNAVLISDTSLYDEGIPTITYGLRGLLYTEIEITGPNRDLHSGSMGGAFANPIIELANLIAKLKDKKGKITIPNFYQDVIPLTRKERANFDRLKFNDKKFAKEYGVKELKGEDGFSTLERLWCRPTLDCNGIKGGFLGEGAKTVIPSKASAKISMRLVPNQKPGLIAKDFKQYIQSLIPNTVKAEVKVYHSALPVVVELDSPVIKAAEKALARSFKRETVFTREGGSIPIVVDFMRYLNVPALLMGFGLDSDNIHSPDEHWDLKNFEMGLVSSIFFLEEYGKNK